MNKKLPTKPDYSPVNGRSASSLRLAHASDSAPGLDCPRFAAQDHVAVRKEL